MKRVCKICNEEKIVAQTLGYCRDCIERDFKLIVGELIKIHNSIRNRFGFKSYPLRDKEGILCNRCQNYCKININEEGICGIRENKDGELVGGDELAKFSWYFDPLPTNCVGSWACPAGSNTGYPEFSYRKGPEYGYKNLAVFYSTCNLNCLFCQNWNYKELFFKLESKSYRELANEIDDTTACICYFGGDPTPQIVHSIKVSKEAMKNKQGKILRICWETNGLMHRSYLEEILQIALISGGCVKFDFKAFTKQIYFALCGGNNKRLIENFKIAGEWFKKRKEPPLIIASTLMVPGYITEEEVFKIAKFIADISPDIPYSLLAFHPTFYMKDLPFTSMEQAQECYHAAKRAGLKKVNIGNYWLLT